MKPFSKEQQHFPFKLYEMLEYADNTEHSSAVSWVDEGRAFFEGKRDALVSFDSLLGLMQRCTKGATVL